MIFELLRNYCFQVLFNAFSFILQFFPLYYVLFSMLWSEILGILWSHVSFQRGKKISKSSLYNSPPSSTQLYLCGMRFCSFRWRNQLYFFPILELLFYSSIELGILKIVILDGRFRALCLDSMSSMMYIWARNMGIFSWISSFWRINFFVFGSFFSLRYTSFFSFLVFLVVGEKNLS